MRENWGIINTSPRVSVCGSKARKGVVSVLQGRISRARWVAGQTSPSPAGQGLWWPMPRKIRAVRKSTLVWSSAVSAVVWSLPELYLESGALHPLGLLISDLAPLVASGEFPQEPVCGWSHSADTAVLITCVGILPVSPCRMCLLWFR